MDCRCLDLDDVSLYIAHLASEMRESGIDGGIHSHPYSASEPYDQEEAREREHRRWTTPLTEPGWRRAWGLFDGDVLVGHLYLAGGVLRSELHRAGLGMGIRRTHHRRGGGRRLLETAIAWARDDTPLEWIDLGVFVENEPALALYRSTGFVEQGRVADRYRVDGHRIDEITMSRSVRNQERPTGATPVQV